MLNKKDLQRIANEEGSLKEKVKDVLQLLNQVSIAYIDHKLVYFDDLNLMDYLHFSSSVIHSNKNHNDKDTLNDLILQKCEHDEIVKRILYAINQISLIEDRDVFVERYCYKDKVSCIIKRHCLYTNGYYQCLERAIADFNDALHLQ